MLSYEEIAERMSEFEIESDQMDEFYEYLGEQGIELIGEQEMKTMQILMMSELDKEKKNLI